MTPDLPEPEDWLRCPRCESDDVDRRVYWEQGHAEINVECRDCGLRGDLL